jgi:hypothetical protein
MWLAVQWPLHSVATVFFMKITVTSVKSLGHSPVSYMLLISCVIILRPSSSNSSSTSPGTSSSPQVHYITTPCSLKFHYHVTHALKILLLGIVCGSFHFVPQSSVVLPFFFVVYTLPFPSFIYSPSCVIHSFLDLLSTFPTKSLTISNIYFWILSHSTSTFSLSHLIP